jgi:hypothetical protein
MGRHGKATQLQERMEIVERSATGASDAGMAEVVGWSRWTERKWRRKGQAQGRSGLASRLGRPASGALSSFDPRIAQAVKALRAAQPGWGPTTLKLELGKDPHLTTLRLPSRSRIAAFLREAGLTRPYAYHTELEQPAPQSVTDPHEEWEMDAQGVQIVAGVGAVSVINIVDRYSRLRIARWGCVGRSKAGTEEYQLACRCGFLRYGLPRRISLDHDTVFYDSNTPSPFPLRFHLWLLALGIEVRFITQAPPAEHAVIERSHTLLTQQALRQTFTTAAQMQAVLDERCAFLNTEYPSRTWHGQAPLVAHPQAQQSPRSYTPETESATLDLQRIYAYLARHHWFRQVSAQGQFTLGGERYGLGCAWAEQPIEITFDAAMAEFVCTSADGQRSQRVTSKGLTKADLMGELPPWDNLPAYQRRLPITPAAQREDTLYHEWAGTTL